MAWSTGTVALAAHCPPNMPLLTELGWRPGVSVATNMPLLRSCFAAALFHRKQRGTKSRHFAGSRAQPEGLAESSGRSPGAWGWRPPGNALADVMHPGKACQKDLARTPTVPPTPAIQIPSGGGSLGRPETDRNLVFGAPACTWCCAGEEPGTAVSTARTPSVPTLNGVGSEGAIC
jgi:hypothetical protein